MSNFLILFVLTGMIISQPLGVIILRFRWPPKEQRKYKVIMIILFVLYLAGIHFLKAEDIKYENVPYIFIGSFLLFLLSCRTLKKVYDKEEEK